MRTYRRVLLFTCLTALAACAAQPTPPPPPQLTLDKIRSTGVITIGFRDGAVPFSYSDPDHSTPTGYVVDLCKHVAEGLQQQLGLAKLDIKWVPVSADDRVQKVISGAVDLECGTTTVTVSREAQVDFSLMTFLDGGSFLALADRKPKTLEDLSRLRIGVSTGTTTEAILREALKDNNVQAELIPVKSHAEGLELLRSGKADLYASDRTVLIGLALTSQPASTFVLSDFMFSYEPYALMMRHDWAFRVAVDKELAALYRKGEIVGIVRHWFGPLGEPPDLLKAMYVIEGIPE